MQIVRVLNWFSLVGERMYRSTWALVREYSVSRLGRFIPRKKPRYPLHKNMGGPQSRSTACLDPTGTWIANHQLSSPYRSQSVYRLCYPRSLYSLACKVSVKIDKLFHVGFRSQMWDESVPSEFQGSPDGICGKHINTNGIFSTCIYLILDWWILLR
jgi:hypothetical protein